MSDQILSAIIAGAVSLAVNGGKWWWDRWEKQNAAKVARSLETILKADGWTKRSFNTIRQRVSGYPDDELRRMLTSIGAVRFKGLDNEELWGLLESNRKDL